MGSSFTCRASEAASLPHRDLAPLNLFHLDQLSVLGKIDRDKIVGMHDATRLATLHNSAMPGPLTPTAQSHISKLALGKLARHLPDQFVSDLVLCLRLSFQMFTMMSPAAFSPAAPAGRSVTAPLQSAPSMGFGKAELAGAHGQLSLRTPELPPQRTEPHRNPETAPRSTVRPRLICLLFLCHSAREGAEPGGRLLGSHGPG